MAADWSLRLLVSGHSPRLLIRDQGDFQVHGSSDGVLVSYKASGPLPLLHGCVNGREITRGTSRILNSSYTVVKKKSSYTATAIFIQDTVGYCSMLIFIVEHYSILYLPIGTFQVWIFARRSRTLNRKYMIKWCPTTKKNIEQCPTENLPLINPATNVCFALPEQVCTVQISKKKNLHRSARRRAALQCPFTNQFPLAINFEQEFNKQNLVSLYNNITG